MGWGTSTSALVTGGYGEWNGSSYTSHTNTQTYNGTSWSADVDLSAARSHCGCCGVGENSGLIVNGEAGEGGSKLNETQEFDGSAWSSGGTAVIAELKQINTSCCGTVNAAFLTGGYQYESTNNEIANTSNYNGTAWSAGESLATARRNTSTVGTQTTAFAAGGVNAAGSYITSTEEFTETVTARTVTDS